MKEICDFKLCTGCGVCLSICPKKCIQFKENEEGFLYPFINQEKCVNCGLCTKNCPILNNFENRRKNVIDSYYGWSNNDVIRYNSSSGGVFSEIAEDIINRGGRVYGAAYNAGLTLTHIGVDCIDDLSKLRGSKYYQSDIRSSFTSVKKDLEEGNTVLFSGTGCQIDALYQFLGKTDISHLLTVEILCHGVPSRKVVLKYIESINKRKDVKSINFRDKSKYGWKYSCVFNVKYSDGHEYYGRSSSDLFYLGFLSEALLRESCYRCKYVGKRRVGDILLADFWGIENADQYKIGQHDIDMGVSFITANSDRGIKMLDILAKNGAISVSDANYDIASKYNKSLVSNYQRPHQRDSIYKNINKVGYRRAIKRAFPITYYRILSHRIVKAILRLNS